MVQDIYTLVFDIQAKGGNTLGQQAKAGATGVNQLNSATATAQQNASQASKSINDMGNSTKNVKTQSAGAGEKMRNFGAGAATAAIGISSLAIGITGLYRNYRDLNDAQLGVDRAQKKLDSSTLQLRTAKTKLREIEKKHGKDSKEYKDQLEKVKIATQGVEIASTNLGEKQEQLSDIQQNFYLNLLPTGIGFLTTISGIMTAFGKNTGGATTAVKSMTTAGRAMNTVLKLSPLFILVGVLLAIRNNTFGIRDAFDKFGAKLGEMFPGLVGFLNWVRELAGAFGLLGGDMDLTKAWELLKNGWNSFVQAVQNIDWKATIIAVAGKIQDAINNFDWATAWKSFQDAMWSFGTWLYESLGKIGDALIKYFSDPAVQKMIWEGFQYAMWATGTWLYEQLGKIGDALIGYFGDPNVQKMIWQGFQYAMWATGSWLYESLGKIGDAIIGYFGDPTVQEALWDGFQYAMYATGTWLLESLGKILNDVFVFFSNTKNTDAMWNGFREAMYAAGKWIGEMLVKMMQYIGKWWNGHKDALTKAFYDFWSFIYNSAITAGKKIPEKIKEGLEKAAGILKSAGEYIWGKIADGLGFAGKSLSEIGTAIANKLQGKSMGGVIRSAQAGSVYTTSGPQLVLAGDNRGGREDVAFIPRNNPNPTLNAIDRIYGRYGRNNTVTEYPRAIQVNITMPIVLGDTVMSEVVKTIEIELGKNMRSIIA